MCWLWMRQRSRFAPVVPAFIGALPGRSHGLICAIVPVGLGIVLLSAATLKLHETATQSVPAEQAAAVRLFWLGVIVSEQALGGWLAVFGFSHPRVWRFAILAFLGFACVSAAKGMLGATSCGCLGVVSRSLSPWYAFVFDVGAVGALLFCGPPNAESVQRQHGQRWIGAALLALGIATVIVLLGLSPTAPASRLLGAAVKNERFALLDPADWIGAPLPIVRRIDIGEQLTANEWVVLFFHHDCQQCQRVMREYGTYWERRASRLPRLAFVEVPAGDRAMMPAGSASVAQLGRLDGKSEWIVETPTIVAIRNGMVEHVAVNPDRGSISSVLDSLSSSIDEP